MHAKGPERRTTAVSERFSRKFLRRAVKLGNFPGFRKHVIETETIVMRSVTGTVRIIKGEHRQFEKFHLD